MAISQGWNTARPLTGGYAQEEVTLSAEPKRLFNGPPGILCNVINPEYDADEDAANEIEMYYGDRERQRNKLVPNAASGILPVDANDLYGRVRVPAPGGVAADPGSLTVTVEIWW